MSKAVDALSKVSGLSGKKIESIWEDVKANSKILDEYPKPHSFQKEKGKRFNDYICSLCGGKINASSAKWYNEGLEDGKII
jgi:hypothetical protein